MSGDPGPGPGPGTLGEVQRRILVVEFKKEVKSSLACLTSVPHQFYDLDIVQTKKAVKILNDRIEDLIEIVSNV